MRDGDLHTDDDEPHTEKGRIKEMELNEREESLIYHVLDELLRKPLRELNKEFGSITINEMMILHSKFYFATYCKKHGITYEMMTEDDKFRAYEEKAEDEPRF